MKAALFFLLENGFVVSKLHLHPFSGGDADRAFEPFGEGKGNVQVPGDDGVDVFFGNAGAEGQFLTGHIHAGEHVAQLCAGMPDGGDLRFVFHAFASFSFFDIPIL